MGAFLDGLTLEEGRKALEWLLNLESREDKQNVMNTINCLTRLERIEKVYITGDSVKNQHIDITLISSTAYEDRMLTVIPERGKPIMIQIVNESGNESLPIYRKTTKE